MEESAATQADAEVSSLIISPTSEPNQAHRINDDKPKIIYFTESNNPPEISWGLSINCLVVIITSKHAGLYIPVRIDFTHSTDDSVLTTFYHRINNVLYHISTDTWRKWFAKTQLTTVVVSRYVNDVMKDFVRVFRRLLALYAIDSPLHWHELPPKVVGENQAVTVCLERVRNHQLVTVSCSTLPVMVGAGDIAFRYPATDTKDESVTDIPRQASVDPEEEDIQTMERIAAASKWLDDMPRPDPTLPCRMWTKSGFLLAFPETN